MFNPAIAAPGVLSMLKAIDNAEALLLIVVCLAPGFIAIYLRPRHRRLGFAWLVVIAGGYLVGSLPVVAGAIADRLPRWQSESAGAWPPLDALIVLDGDNRRGRAREAMQVFDLTARPAVLVLGNRLLFGPLQSAGIPRARMTNEDDTPTTRDQVARVRAIVATGQVGRTAVIASRLQMPRVAALTRAQRLHVLLIPSPIDAEPPTAGIARFVPTLAALRLSRDALYEHAALAYYRWNGWTK